MATTYLDADEAFIAASAGTIFGVLGGNESVSIIGTPALTLDANIENITLEGNVADYTVGITGTTITFFDAGVAVVTILGLEQDAAVTFADGVQTLALTGLNAATLGDQSVPTTPGPITPVVSDYTLTAGATSVDEGATATFAVTNTTVAEGTTVDYTISGVDAADVDGGALTGTATIDANGDASISVVLLADGVTEGEETLTVTLADGVVASTVVNDTSAAPTFTLTTDASSVLEGAVATYTVTASSAVTADTDVTFTVLPDDSTAVDQGTSSTNLDDFLAGTFNPSVVTMAAGATTATFTVTGANDGLTELPENYSVNAAIAGQTDMSVTMSMLDGAGTFTLTTGADSGAAFTGGVANDTFNGSDVGVVATWTTGDAIDGGSGTDIFNVTQSAAITTPVGATVANIETANMVSGSTGTSITTTSWSGLTTLNVTGVGAIAATAAASTDVSVIGSASVATATSVDGGNNVSITSTGGNGGTIAVGATTAAGGTVTVNATSGTANGDTGDAIAVTGGTVIDVTQVAGNAASAAVSTTAGAVTIIGDSSTTSVSVADTAKGTASSTVVGRANGAVTITDANAASLTAAGTITTATVTSGAAVIVNSSALTTLNIGSTLTSVNAGTLGALTTAAVDTLALNLTGAVSTATVTIDTDITTLNISGNTTTSTINSLVATGATAVNVSGDAMVTLTADTLTAVTDIVVTNTAGASFGTALGTAVNFTGGDGADTVSLGATTKAITMGAGNDTVISAGLVGTGGSVAAGDGTGDKIVMTSAQAAVADNDATFNTKFTGFETLRVSDILAGGATLDLAGINSVSTVELVLGGNHATTAIISNLVDGGTVNTLASSTGIAVEVSNALFNASDTLNFGISNAVAATTGTFTAAGIETLNINVDDATTTTAGGAAVTHVISTLAATSATTINVDGNNGLTITAATGSASVTTFDASGVVANGTAGLDTAANLAVTYSSLNTTTTAAVSITGGDGDDVLTGNAAVDTIIGGAGDDTMDGGVGIDILSGGTGADTIIITDTAQSDTMTGGTGIDTFSFTDATGTNVATEFAAMLKQSAGTTAITAITDFVAGTDIIELNSANYDMGTSMVVATAQTIATADTLTEVYAGITAIAASVAGAALSSVVVTVSAGVDAGTYLYINDETAGIAAADDMLINITGVSGTITAADFAMV